MNKTLGMLETNSIAKGVEAADQMTKTAEVNVLQARPVCPGKYIVMISGDIGSVESAMKTGKMAAGNFLVDDLMIPNLQEQVPAAIAAAGEVKPGQSLGIAEFFSAAAAVSGADEAVKTADVRLIEIRMGLGIGGKSFFTLTGALSAVEEAIKAGIKEAEEKGTLVAFTVIPSVTDQQMWQFLL